MKLFEALIERTAIRTDLGAIFISLELSTTPRVVSPIRPGRQKVSKHTIKAGSTAVNAEHRNRPLSDKCVFFERFTTLP